jgi:sodium transport system permease protein
MRRIWIILKKEALDNLRDRRTIWSSIFGTMFTPVLLLALIIIVGRSINVDPQDKPLQLPVIGTDYAPDLISFLKQNNVEITSAPSDPETAVREGKQDVILVILPEYPDAFRAGKPAPIRLIEDSSRTSAVASIQRVTNLIGIYRGKLSALRLQARGVDPTILASVSIGVRDVATPQSQALIFLNMMPFLLTLNVFSGGMGVIIDATAGERERGSLEPLLLNPARRREFVLGKLFAALPFALSSLGLVIVFLWLGFRFVPLEDFIGFPMTLDGGSLINIFLLLLPEIFLASAMQMLVATFTRSFKEAQTYLSIMPLIIGMPGMFLSFMPVQSDMIKMLIPTYGQSLLINQILRGETILPAYWIAATLSTIVVAALLTLAAIRLYEGERAVFGKQ